jgi:hypothetical protein
MSYKRNIALLAAPALTAAAAIALWPQPDSPTLTIDEPPAAEAAPAVITNPPATTATTAAKIVAPAEVEIQAQRLDNAIQATPTLPPPPSPRQIVNEMTYTAGEPGPAMEAFRIVALETGWSADKAAAWAPFMDDVFRGESLFCPNVLNGAQHVLPVQPGCNLAKQGTKEDAGFGQLTRAHYGPGKWLCTDHGICDKWTIISEPWISMQVVVWLVDRSGSFPWCWNEWARGYHDCWLAPDR